MAWHVPSQVATPAEKTSEIPQWEEKKPQNRKLKSNKDLSEKSCFSLGEEGVWEDDTEKRVQT